MSIPIARSGGSRCAWRVRGSDPMSVSNPTACTAVICAPVASARAIAQRRARSESSEPVEGDEDPARGHFSSGFVGSTFSMRARPLSRARRIRHRVHRRRRLGSVRAARAPPKAPPPSKLEAHRGRSRPRAHTTTRPLRGAYDTAAPANAAKSPEVSSSEARGSARCGVEASETKDPVGPKLFDYRSDDFVETPPGRRPRSVPDGRGMFTVCPSASGTTAIFRPSRARIKRPLVRRHVEHTRIVPKDRLGPVSMVHVPIDDADALPSIRQMMRLRSRCC